MRIGSALFFALALATPGCVIVTDFGALHGTDESVDGGGIDAPAFDATPLDVPRGDAPPLDVPRGDAPPLDVGPDVPNRDAPAPDGCTVDVVSTCAGRCDSVEDTTCGVSIDCGDPCVAPLTCGGGGMATFCGCTPEPLATTCAGHCGAVTNRCGTTVDCGDPCARPQTCGGGGTPSVCGCTPDPDPCGAAHQVCGPISNGCGGSVSCGGCPSGRTCCRESCAPPGGECP